MNKSALLREIGGERSGIPHLAKNERDVGHPAMVAGLEPKSAFLPSSTSLLKSETWGTNQSLDLQLIFDKAKRSGGTCGSIPATNRRVPHPSRSLRRVGYANVAATRQTASRESPAC
jgi:hypothetical protein